MVIAMNVVPQMENKIHQRKIKSSTSIKEKNDGQKAGTGERTVLAIVIAPPHLQNSLPLQKCSCLVQGGQQS